MRLSDLIFPTPCAGAGQPARLPCCALFHGFTGSPADWDPWLPDPARALKMDVPGHGASPAPTGTFRDEIRRILASLPPSIDRLAGYSLGGRLVLGLLEAAPTRWQVVTVISAHPGIRDPAERAARRCADRRWIELLRTGGIVPFVAAWEAQPLFASQRRLPPSMLARQRARRLGHSAEGLARSLEILGLAEMPSLWEAVADFSGQLRWIVGRRDVKFLDLARQVAALRPTTELVVLDAGHNPLLELSERQATCATGQ